MKTIKTHFGATLYTEELSHDRHYADREDESKVKFFDSRKKYLDYFEISTLEELAEWQNSTPEIVLGNFVETIEHCQDIETLLNFVFVLDWHFCSTSWKAVADWMVREKCYFDTDDVTEEDILTHDCVNVIGDYIIVVAEC
jgi:hypothetical protein